MEHGVWQLNTVQDEAVLCSSDMSLILYQNLCDFFFQCHHMSSQTSWSPPPLMWLKCNQLLKLGRPVGAVTLSR